MCNTARPGDNESARLCTDAPVCVCVSLQVLVGASGQLLRPGGELCVILPADEGQADTFTDLASLHSLILVSTLYTCIVLGNTTLYL